MLLIVFAATRSLETENEQRKGGVGRKQKKRGLEAAGFTRRKSAVAGERHQKESQNPPGKIPQTAF